MQVQISRKGFLQNRTHYCIQKDHNSTKNLQKTCWGLFPWLEKDYYIICTLQIKRKKLGALKEHLDHPQWHEELASEGKQRQILEGKSTNSRGPLPKFLLSTKTNEYVMKPPTQHQTALGSQFRARGSDHTGPLQLQPSCHHTVFKATVPIFI